jgi:hypothetical protein
MSVRRAIVICAIAGFGGLVTAPAWAATYPPTGPPPSASVKGIETSRPVVVHQTHGSLPFTGADIAAVTAAGVVAVAAGAVAVTASRRGGKHT